METPQGEQSTLSATVRAEELLDRTGQRLAIFALQARQRLQETVSSIRAEADRMDQPSQQEEARAEAHNGAAHTDQKTPLNNAPGITRAEVIVGTWTQRISATASVSSLRVQRLMARMREEAEDIWAEAQDIQRRGGERQRQRESGQGEVPERKASAEQKTRARKGDETQGQHRKRGSQRERSTKETAKARVEHRDK